MVTAFVLAKLFVLKGGQRPVDHSAFFFILVNLLAVLQTLGISLLLANNGPPKFGVNQFVPEISHALGVAFPEFTSYFGHKRISFQ
jgi:putative flippase GtrA